MYQCPITKTLNKQIPPSLRGRVRPYQCIITKTMLLNGQSILPVGNVLAYCGASNKVSSKKHSPYSRNANTSSICLRRERC